MITASEIKRIASLREKKYREALGLFVVEGEKMVGEALASEYEVVNVWRIEDIGERAMAKITSMTTPSPVLALVRKPAGEKDFPCKGLCVGLDSVRDPGNLGTIIRVCDWFGADCLYLSVDCVETFNPKVIQASMGSVFRVRTISADLVSLCRRFKEASLPVYGTFLDGTSIYSSELGGEGLIIMGNESNGISQEVAGEVGSRLRIPSCSGSGAESLNVAVATAVTLAEFRRR